MIETKPRWMLMSGSQSQPCLNPHYPIGTELYFINNNYKIQKSTVLSAREETHHTIRFDGEPCASKTTYVYYFNDWDEIGVTQDRVFRTKRELIASL